MKKKLKKAKRKYEGLSRRDNLKSMKTEKLKYTFNQIKKNRECYFMLAPFMIFFLIFTVIPVVMSLPISFTDFDVISYPEFVGLSNFYTLFLSDKVFLQSIKVTLIFACFTGPVSYVMCFLLAWFINELPQKLKTIFTLIFYIPSMAGVYTVWKIIFSGIITQPVQWLTDSRYILGVTIAVQLWISLGAGFLALRAGFQNIDRSQYEAGAIEGIKNRWQELFYITIPSMGPQLLFAAVMQIVGSFTAGTVAQNIVGFPSTDYKAHTIMTHAYDYGWVRFEMGYASAICMVLFVLMYIINRIINKILNKYLD